MLIEQTSRVPVPIDHLWDFLLDVPALSRCVPGLEEFSEVGPNAYAGTVRVRVGPVSLRLLGQLRIVAQDRAQWSIKLNAEGTDSRFAGSVTADITINLVVKQAAETELNVSTRATILGKLGEFGQPIIKRTANKVMEVFVRNMADAIGSRQLSQMGIPFT